MSIHSSRRIAPNTYISVRNLYTPTLQTAYPHISIRPCRLPTPHIYQTRQTAYPTYVSDPADRLRHICIRPKLYICLTPAVQV